MRNDDLQFYPSDENENPTAATTEVAQEVDLAKALELLKKFANVGNQLSETYSDENQETGVGFTEGLNSLAEIQNYIQQQKISNLSVKDTQGLLNMCTYLEKKLKRRATAMSANNLNI